jgi:hypothetical protein
VLDHDDRLATASRNDDLTFVSTLHGVKSALLVRAKGDGQVLRFCRYNYYTAKKGV